MRQMSLGLELDEEHPWRSSKLCLSVMAIAKYVAIVPFLALGGGGGLLTNVDSSNGRHLKSFL